MVAENGALIGQGMARVNVTYAGQNGDLPDPVSFDASDEEIKRYVSEAITTGGIPNIPGDTNPDFTNFKVDRFAATDARPYPLLQLRPKTPFGLD